MGQIRAFASLAAIAMLAMTTAMGWQRFQSDPALQKQVLNDIPGFANPAFAAGAKPAAPKLVRVATLATQIPLPQPTAPSSGEPKDPPAPPPQVDESALQADAVAERIKYSVPSE